MLYACDDTWWRIKGPTRAEFTGLRFIGKGAHPGCVPCSVEAGDNHVWFDGKRLGAGGNSGFQALNLAAAAGATKIVLTGYDMSIDNGVHWHGEHEGMTNPSARMLKGCAGILDEVAHVFSSRGIDVVNASKETALLAYRRMTLDEALS